MIGKILRKILLRLLVSLVGLFLLVWGGLFIARQILYPEYLKNGEKVCTIPKIHSGFTPQGICYDEESDTYLFSGFNGEYSEIHLVTKGESKEVTLQNADGTPTKGHSGGLTCIGKYVYLSQNNELVIFSLSEMLAAEDMEAVRSIGTFPVETQSSFCYSNDEYIYVGEFYRPVVYETDPSHYYTTPSGADNRAIVSCYPLAPDGSIADKYPLYSISIPHQVQGFATEGDTFILSRSWGLTNSTLDVYTGLLDSGKQIDVSGKSVPLYYLDQTNFTKTLIMPAFSEEIDISDGQVIVNFESAANKYFVGKLFFATNAVSYPLDALTK